MKPVSLESFLLFSISTATDVLGAGGVSDHGAGAAAAAAAARDNNTMERGGVVAGRDLQQSCDTTAAYHPDYTLGWERGKCDFVTTCNSPSYATELECCQEAYAGQTSKYCFSQLANPPTSSPTVEMYYADYTLPWTMGMCISTSDVPAPTGRSTFATMEECCDVAYAGQVSDACNVGTRPPTGAPTATVAATFYPDYSLPWPQGKCIDTSPMPTGRPTYTSQLACCKAAYGGQVSKACINDLANPPTSSPTQEGGPDVYYPDYSLAWTVGTCINTVPVPSGRPTYTTPLECCEAAYRGQVSETCVLSWSD